MNFFHFHAGMVSRTTGRSAVAAAAYISRSKLYNEYDGRTHDYHRKHDCIYREILLPENAPEEWKDRQALWNDVEGSEKAKDARLARTIIVALPKELRAVEWVTMTRRFLRDECVSQGMCADFAIHSDSKNPHAHIMLTVRPLDEQGNWASKTQKEYICRKPFEEEERHLTAEEFKAAKADGWEKVYPYQRGKNKKTRVNLTPTEAAQEVYAEYTRVSKSPCSTRFGRQNPVAEKWNSKEMILGWRESWEELINHAQERNGIADRVSCHSYKEQGIIDRPTIHEGTAARIEEKNGGVNERCELNREIRKDNRLLHFLIDRMRELLRYLTADLRQLASYFHSMRMDQTAHHYRQLYNSQAANKLESRMRTVRELVDWYDGRKSKITALNAQNYEMKRQLMTPGLVPDRVDRETLRNTIMENERMIDRMESDLGMDLYHEYGITDAGDVNKLREQLPKDEEMLKDAERSNAGFQTLLDANADIYALIKHSLINERRVTLQKLQNQISEGIDEEQEVRNRLGRGEVKDDLMIIASEQAEADFSPYDVRFVSQGHITLADRLRKKQEEAKRREAERRAQEEAAKRAQEQKEQATNYVRAQYWGRKDSERDI